MPCPTLPVEVLEHIVKDLACNDPKRVKNCALTCWALLGICRKYLFAKVLIVISAQSLARREEGIFALLRKSPEIAGYTRYLHIRIANDGERNWVTPPELKLFSKLRTYEISFDPYPPNHSSFRSRYPHSDDAFLNCTETLVPTLRKLLFRPIRTLVVLKLDRMTNFPFCDVLRNFPNVRTLMLTNMEVNKVVEADSEIATVTDSRPTQALPGLNPIKLRTLHSDCWGSFEATRALTIKKLLDLRQPNGQAIFDFSRLKILHIRESDVEETGLAIALPKLLLQTHQLTKFILDHQAAENITLSGVGQALVASRMTLKTLRIKSSMDDFDDDPLHGLPDELAIFGAQLNVLESLSLEINMTSGCSTGNEWGELDEVLDTLSWPKLKSVSIVLKPRLTEPDMEFSRSDSYEDGDMVPEDTDFDYDLKALRTLQFPELLRKSKKSDFRFQFKVLWESY
ncbi:hypothetical protein BDN70DRAFT_878809 [Pholiota conissans]|uniref:F-box domain-containing protein n=1 Tax=Pholiota conissans TaxID=109636 RepID=A0A9P5Z360_9AGAR|nr:hypothetical protein BDN70DRAFT_878809 [Pholiota conissans]